MQRLLASWSDLPPGSKVLILGGATVVAVGTAWLLLDAGDDSLPSPPRDRGESRSPYKPSGDCYYKVTDPTMGIAVRSDADTDSTWTPHTLMPGEVFEVAEIVTGKKGQTYLRLLDGRGWGFSQSAKTGQDICAPCTVEEVEAVGGTVLDKVQRMLEKDPAMRRQLAMVHGLALEELSDPQTLREMAKRILCAEEEPKEVEPEAL